MRHYPERMQFGQKTRLGRYEICQPLGAGGMGEVYRGVDTHLGRPVAIKVLRSDLPQASELRQRLAHEAHVLSALNHPNICTLHDVIGAGGQPALIMELLEGRTLADRLSESPIPVEQVIHIGAQVASALAAAHQKGILHRDVKPGNIFLTVSGHVKVLDFGVAKLWDTETRRWDFEETRSIESSPVTAPGALLGTFGYMAPEQALGKPLDPRSDIFSLGAVLYELCTGEPPFTGRTLPALFDALLHDTLVPASKRNAKVSTELDAILRRVLQKDPARRQQNATELERDLTRLAATAGWSGAGKTFVFASKGNRNDWDIYSQRVGGQNSVNLTGDSNWDDIQPAFSADGERIAFRSERDGGGIFVMGATGEQVRKVSDVGYNPSWSPDGNQLVVATEAVMDSMNRGRASQLWTLEIATGEKSPL